MQYRNYFFYLLNMYRPHVYSWRILKIDLMNFFRYFLSPWYISGLWGVVNNAGIMPSYAPAEWTSLDEYERTCKVNLFGTISVTLTFLPLLRQSQGRLVNVCSVTSNCGYPGISDYVVSKAGIKMFTSCIR